jgi:hypothetical protein
MYKFSSPVLDENITSQQPRVLVARRFIQKSINPFSSITLEEFIK